MIEELSTGEEQLHTYLRMVDLVIEVRDARAPESCVDRMFERLSQRRERIIVLSQADRADAAVTAEWRRYLEIGGTAVFAMDLKRGTGLAPLKKHFKNLGRTLSKRRRHRAFPGGNRPVRAMVVGVPNTGKSSLINRLAGHRKARVGARPGITRGPQWIKISRNLELLDTPGVLTPETNRTSREILAITGSVPVESVDVQELVGVLLELLPEEPAKALYGMAGAASRPLPPSEFLDLFARKRSFLLQGGKPDRHRAAMAIISSFRKGDLGTVSLEMPSFEQADVIRSGEERNDRVEEPA